MKSIVVLSVVALFLALPGRSQQLKQDDVSLTMDLQPILQLNTSTPSNISFDFNEVRDYSAGITQYGATTLRVTSTVNWDMYAIAGSTGNVAPGYWDLQAAYGAQSPRSVNKIPLSALELHQSNPNQHASAATGVYKDYSAPFPPVNSPAGSNSVYVDPANAGTPPGAEHKYIAGHAGITSTGADGVSGGSYLTAGASSNSYYYNIDYRIVPGLPVTFPMAYDASGTSSQSIDAVNGPGAQIQPGLYTMQLSFILLEDQ
jgi:hypothetical protein